jgi:hypothetical protein
VWHRNQKELEVQSPQQPPRRWRREMLRWGTRRVAKKSGFAPTKFISHAVNGQDLSWTIGSKPSANSEVGRYNARAD